MNDQKTSLAYFKSAESFSEVEGWLRDLPNQTAGIPTAICETGEPYVEFSEGALARPVDAKVIERVVAARISSRLSEYLGARRGRIYWRVPFESVVQATSIVDRFDESGPDHDFTTDRRCFLDRNWVRVACYCRVYRATHGFDGFDISVSPTPKAVA